MDASKGSFHLLVADNCFGTRNGRSCLTPYHNRRTNNRGLLGHNKYDNLHGIFDKQCLAFFHHHNNLKQGISIFFQGSSFFWFGNGCYRMYHIG